MTFRFKIIKKWFVPTIIGNSKRMKLPPGTIPL